MTSDEIKQSTSMQEVLNMFGLKVNRKGFMCCPFHKEKTPSMKIYEKKYHCFGCGEDGDVFSFVMKYQGCDFKEAFKILGGGYENTDYGRERVKRSVAIRKARQNTAADMDEIRTLVAQTWNLADEINAGLKNAPDKVFSDEHEELITLRNAIVYFWEYYIIDRREVTTSAKCEILKKCNRIIELKGLLGAD